MAHAMQENRPAKTGESTGSSPHPRRRWRRTLLVLLLVAAAAFVADALLYDRWSAAPDGSALGQQANAAWLAPTWVFQQHVRADADGLAEDLAAGEISLVFMDCGSADASGRLPARNDGHVMALLAWLRQASPGVTILARIRADQGPNIADPQVRRTLVGEADVLLSVVGFDGVQYDPGPGDDIPSLQCLLQETASVVGEDPLLSVVGPPIAPDWARLKGFWRAGQYAQLAPACDILAVRLQDLRVSYPRGYVALVAWETREIARIVGQVNPNCWLYVGVPASHGERGRSLRNAIKGVVSGLRAGGAQAGAIRGLALDDYDTATDADWQQWDAYWLGE